MERQRIKYWYDFKYIYKGYYFIDYKYNSHLYRFFTNYHIPGVIGIIDGSQIGIFPPVTNNTQYPEFIYVNRKGFHAINAQFVNIYLLKSVPYNFF